MWEDFRELGFFCILNHIPCVCGPTHAMPTCIKLLISRALICDGTWRISREFTNRTEQAGKISLHWCQCRLTGKALKLGNFSRWGWFACVRHGNSLEVCRVSPGRIIVVLIWTKHAVPCQLGFSVGPAGTAPNPRLNWAFFLSVTFPWTFHQINIKTRLSPLTFLSHVVLSKPTGLNNVCACARSHGSRWRQRPGHYNKPRKKCGAFKTFRMVPGLWWKGRATQKKVERDLYTSSLDHFSAYTLLYSGV